ncbi:hypothetical protein AB0M20_27925, partial [Actinoplanes sp. NPDC051633]|uniref:hypothetical protein n=1 Tax=Actinoplanes sp. NPDC051633 TaxID=3155670 RepID=UPI00342D826C
LMRLAAVVARGPETMATNPPLPQGAALPAGAAPAAIADDALRDQAKALADDHREEAARWNAKQQALRHLEHLADLLRTPRPGFTDDPDVEAESAAALALARSGL